MGDWTSNRWVTCFADQAEKILGKTSQEVGDALEMSKEEGAALLATCHFQRLLFKLRIKQEVYGDQARSKITVQNVGPINYKEYNQHMIKNIQQLTGISTSN